VSLLDFATQPLTFEHGVHPEERKEATSKLPVQRMPFVKQYVLPLSQHTGAPSIPIVAPGQSVVRGQLIGEPDGFISAALHTPVTGTVRAVELCPHPDGRPLPAIVIDADPFASQGDDFVRPPPLADLSPDEAVEHIRGAGIVGLGGAAFPAHVKVRVPDGKQCETVILNGSECEPYLTCDHRIMVERPEAVIQGLLIKMYIAGAPEGVIGVEVNKEDAIEALGEAAKPYPDIHVVPLQVKYPQGAKQLMIDTLLRKRIPRGARSIDLGVIIHNVATAAALADYFETGKPLVERVITVSGGGVRRPGNYLVPIGTPVRDILDQCGGLDPATKHVILGGPMMGMAQKTLDVPLMKGSPGVLGLRTRSQAAQEEQPCIKCGRCIDACAMFLNPSHLATAVRSNNVETLRRLHLGDCFECGSCAFSCPSNIPLLQMMRMGKNLLRKS
jgi:electron transport complex protein RnfC